MQEILKNIADLVLPILIQQGPEIFAGITALLYTRDWQHLKKVAEEESLKLAESALTSEEKLNATIEAVYNALPRKMKVFPVSLFVNPETIKNLVNLVYVTRVKPKRDVEGSNPSAKQLLQEIETIKEVVKKTQPRDEKGRFKKADE